MREQDQPLGDFPPAKRISEGMPMTAVDAVEKLREVMEHLFGGNHHPAFDALPEIADVLEEHVTGKCARCGRALNGVENPRLESRCVHAPEQVRCTAKIADLTYAMKVRATAPERPDQCMRESYFLIDGRAYCWTHASVLALRILLGEDAP